MNPVAPFLGSERRPLIAWSVGLAAFTLLLGLVYASFDDPAELDRLLENYPEELLEVFGGAGQEIGSVKGFLGVEMAAYMPLLLGIFAVMYATKHLSGAEENGALDHLLARPITRQQYYWGLIAAGSITLTTMLLGASLGGIIGFAVAGASARDLVGIVGLMLDFLPIALLYLALGALTGSLNHRRATANIVGIVVVIVFFAIDVVARLVDDLDWLVWLTPHGYLGKSDLFDGDPHLGYLVFCLGLGGVLAWAGSWWFDRKDLYA